MIRIQTLAANLGSRWAGGLAFGAAFVGTTASAHAQTDPPATALAERIYGGEISEACGWPTCVWLGGCTGTLVHPEVVIYAAHCNANINQVHFGHDRARTVQTKTCKTFSGGANSAQKDIAYCILEEAVEDVPIIPILMGDETDVLTEGRKVWVVGYGQNDIGAPRGKKLEVETEIVRFDRDAIGIGGGGKDSCFGDSGGPVYVQLDDGTWRVFGITSRGFGADCGPGGWYSMMHIGIDWFERESGYDLTPCHTTDGTCDDSVPGCGPFPTNPREDNGTWADGCSEGAMVGPTDSCGGSDMDPPTVAISSPSDGHMVEVGTNFEVSVDAADAVALGEVTLELDGTAFDPLDMGPFTWAIEDLEIGSYTFVARAVDMAGNMAESEPVVVEVTEVDDSETTEEEDGDESESSGDDESSTGDDESGDEDSSGDEKDDEDEEDEGEDESSKADSAGDEEDDGEPGVGDSGSESGSGFEDSDEGCACSASRDSARPSVWARLLGLGAKRG